MLFPIAVPRLLTRIFCKIQGQVKGNVVKSFMLNTGVHFKQKQMKMGQAMRHDTVWDKVVFKKMRETLGGSMRLIISGSAPLNPQILDFLRCTLGCVVRFGQLCLFEPSFCNVHFGFACMGKIFEGYGQTECVAPATVTYPDDYNSGETNANHFEWSTHPF